MKTPALADIGVVGLAVMGENLILNMAGKGFTVACFNRTVSRVDEFLAGRGAGMSIVGCHSLEELVGSLARPRRVMCMVKAGEAVDALMASLTPLLDPGDVIIDGGNSHFRDTMRRIDEAEKHGLLFVGAGVSGGEEGALHGPSIMPGGSEGAWDIIRPIFQRICAMTPDGEPCCEWMGEGGAGHFVKMVHNGIEYGDMQLICEVYHLMKAGFGMSNEDMRAVFSRWNKGRLDSYLIEITADILGFRDEDGAYPLDVILDAAQQKGTGKWTVGAALDVGQPLTLIGEAVFARALSALKDERLAASKVLTGPSSTGLDVLFEDFEEALYAAKIVSYAQGFQLLRAQALEQGWKLDYGKIARIWRGGCIIRSVFLKNIESAFSGNPGLVNLLLDPFFSEAVMQAQAGWRRVVAAGALSGIPMPTLSAALAYFDSYRAASLPANLLQAQRDYFGAHTYERTDRPRGERFHTNWTGRGGATSSTSYEV
jgi:6-phosphogluconate dehydrogenase